MHILDILNKKIKYWVYPIFEITLIKFFKLKGYNVIHFLHIGKTGGTAIKATLLKYNKSYFGKIVKINHTLIILHSHSFCFNHVEENELVFFAIRDPIQRFISGFYSRYRKILGGKVNKWTFLEEKYLRLFDNPNSLAEALSSDDGILKEEAISAMRTILHIKNSILDWFISEEYFKKNKHKIFLILRQENLNEDFAIFQKALKMKPFPLHDDPITSHKMPDHFNINLSYKARKNLLSWYHNDYEFLRLLNGFNFYCKY